MAKCDRKDKLHQLAKKDGLRSRAAYRLEEIQKQFKILSKGNRVAGLGCWPVGLARDRFEARRARKGPLGAGLS